MAKKAEEKKQTSIEELEAQLDARKDIVSLDTPDLKGWYDPEKGDPVYGQIVGAFSIKDENGNLRDVLIVILLRDCRAVDNQSEVVVKAGDALGLGVRADLSNLMYYVESQAVIFVKPTGKKKLRGKRSMWQFKTRVVSGAKSEKRFSPEPKKREQDMVADDIGDGDIPF